MNILFFSSNSPYSEKGLVERRIGGAEIILKLIAEEFGKLDHNVYYYSTKRGMPVRRTINGVYTYHYPKIYIPLIHKNIKSIKKLNEKIILYQQIKHIERIIKEKKIDIINTYSTYPDTHLAIMAAKKYNVPIVQQIMGRVWYNLIRENPNLKVLIERTFNNVDMLLFPSDFIKDQTYNYFKKIGINVNTTSKRIVGIGINYDQINNLNIENTKRKYNLHNDKKILFCVGSFKDYSKRQDLLIKATPTILEKFDNVRIIFAGEGPKLQHMKELAIKLGVNQRISFLGSISHEDTLAIISIAEIVIHPTEFEGGLCNVIREAMALGTSIITSNIEANKLLEKLKAGLLVNNNPSEFTHKIIYLLKNEDRKRLMEQNAAAYAKKNFNSKKNILRYEKIFSEITEKNQ